MAAYHRHQSATVPRASDLPDEHEKNLMNANDAMSKEDAALDKKIKSICRGC